MWEDQVLGQEFRNISCLVTQLEGTGSTADSERFQCVQKQSSFEVLCILVIHGLPFGPLPSGVQSGRHLVTVSHVL